VRKEIRGACGISRRLVMCECESDFDKTAELKEKIEREIDELLLELNAGTIDRNDLESGLKKIRTTVKKMPPFKK
jgi:hypothetical protein